MKVLVMTHNQLPHSHMAGGGHNWTEDMTMERLAVLTALPKCEIRIQTPPIPSAQFPDVKLWITIYGCSWEQMREIENGGEPGWGT